MLRGVKKSTVQGEGPIRAAATTQTWYRNCFCLVSSSVLGQGLSLLPFLLQDQAAPEAVFSKFHWNHPGRSCTEQLKQWSHPTEKESTEPVLSNANWNRHWLTHLISLQATSAATEECLLFQRSTRQVQLFLCLHPVFYCWGTERSRLPASYVFNSALFKHWLSWLPAYKKSGTRHLQLIFTV